MSQSKREQVVSHLRYIRQELREMHQGVMEDGLLPEAGEVRGVMAQMEALLELLVNSQQILLQQEMLKNQQFIQEINRNRVLIARQVAGRVMGINWWHTCCDEV